jgi:hypothetical protein
MKDQNFTTLIEEKLLLLELPEVIQQVVVSDLAEIILKRSYAELMSKLGEEDGTRIGILLDSNDFDAAYTTIIQVPGAEDLTISLAEAILEDFGRQMKESL